MNNINSVLEQKMCCGCGACYSACPTKCISFVEGKYVNYPVVNEETCIDCGICKNICPGQMNINRLINGEKVNLYNNISSIKVSYSKNDNIRVNSASGGIISELIVHLLENNQVDCGVVVTQSNNNPLFNEVRIIRESKDIHLSQGSRYSPASNCTILREIINNDEYRRVIFIGKPCDIEALAAYESINRKLREKIFIKLSIMCHHSPTRKGLINLLTAKNISIESIDKINFRGDGWPGTFKVVTKNKKVLKMDYYEAWGNYLSQDENIKCMYCENPFPLEADLVVGDPWGEEYKEDKKGKSLVLIRNNTVEDIMSELEENKKIVSTNVTYKDVQRYQKNLLKRHSEFNLNRLLFKRVHGYKINFNDIKCVYKENPKNLIRYIKRVNSYNKIFDKWKYE